MTQISGKVIHGDHFGKTLGFPTANLDRREYARRRLKIKLGVYAGHAEINHKFYRAGIVIGPLDGRNLPKIEAYLIGFKGNLYGKDINIFLYRYMRSFKKFKNIEQLKQQIHKDIISIKKITK